MSEAKHTPGPWFAHQCGVYETQPTKPGDPWENCIAMTGDDPDPEEGHPGATALEQIANARLIAAAPDMLAALKNAMTAADDDLKQHRSGRTDDCAKAYAMCEAAVAKAEGRS